MPLKKILLDTSFSLLKAHFNLQNHHIVFLEIKITMDEKKEPSDIGVLSDGYDIDTGVVESQGFDETATKKLLRKLDWHIIPFMSLIYL